MESWSWPEGMGGRSEIESQQVSEGAGGERCRQLRAEFGDARRRKSRHEFSGTFVHPCGVFVEPISRREPVGERRSVTVVAFTVGREHRWSDDLGGGEPGVVDREALRVAHDLDCGAASGDHPGVEGGDPRDRRFVSRGGQDGVRVGRQIVERRGAIVHSGCTSTIFPTNSFSRKACCASTMSASG